MDVVSIILNFSEDIKSTLPPNTKIKTIIYRATYVEQYRY
jgi:hypothetical protein